GNWLKAQSALLAHGLAFPAIAPDLFGELLHRREGAYRLTLWLPGQTPPAGQTEAAFLAGRFLGQCHQALNSPLPLIGLEPLPRGFEFTNQKLTVQEDFDEIFAYYRRHPNLTKLAPTIGRAGQAARRLPRRPAFTRVFLARDLVVHADPKRENFLTDGQSVALVDWDTVGYGDPLIDLGEMCRSFATVKTKSSFELSLAMAAVRGYEETGLDLAGQIPLLLPAVIRALALRLVRRYLVDALAEVYFSWDQSRFESLFAQNEARALALLGLAEELEDREMEISRAFSS
ncbi:MAG: phosphotransferase, partial [Deltaproteobacteria bacterium]|nr:phosphotransferase [Deltaproteobacteria bacterium]